MPKAIWSCSRAQLVYKTRKYVETLRIAPFHGGKRQSDFYSFWQDLGFGGCFFLFKFYLKKYWKNDFYSFWLAWLFCSIYIYIWILLEKHVFAAFGRILVLVAASYNVFFRLLQPFVMALTAFFHGSYSQALTAFFHGSYSQALTAFFHGSYSQCFYSLWGSYSQTLRLLQPGSYSPWSS